ncbi:MAG: dihydropteroate synthase [Verrucomicrobiota bacterium]
MNSLRQERKVTILNCLGKTLELGMSTRIMGILNVTPDSFSDGGNYTSSDQAIEHAVLMQKQGAAILDVGGQSTRPGYSEVSEADEISRVVPIIEALKGKLTIPISIDSYRASVAKAALTAGAHLINDQHGFQGDELMPHVASDWKCPVVLMHCDKHLATQAGSLIDCLKRYFESSLKIADRFSIPHSRLILDPGIGFYKTQPQNLEIIAKLSELRTFGLPLLLGASRKSVIAHVLGGDPQDRLEGTLVTSALAAAEKIEIIRVHDVKANLRAVGMAEAVFNARNT